MNGIVPLSEHSLILQASNEDFKFLFIKEAHYVSHTTTKQDSLVILPHYDVQLKLNMSGTFLISKYIFMNF